MTGLSLATKQDVEEIVGRVVGEIVSDALVLINGRFDKLEKRMDRAEKRADTTDSNFKYVDQRFDHMDKRFDRVEDKLDAAVARLDHQDIDIRELQRKTA